MNENEEVIPVQDVCCQLMFTPTQFSKEFLCESTSLQSVIWKQDFL
jgi:hypothetical protein